MELLVDRPGIDLYDDSWPIRTDRPQCPPPRFVGQGFASQSIVSGGSIVGGHVEQSVLSTNCRVAPEALVESSVLLQDVEVGRGCRITNALIGPGCRIPAGAVIGRSPLIGIGFGDYWPAGVTLVTTENLAQAELLSSGRMPAESPVVPAVSARDGGDWRGGMRVIR
jgi:glucose-1-phosphate adenylyltransferase